MPGIAHEAPIELLRRNPLLAVLETIVAANLDEDRLETYTHLIRIATPEAARPGLEALMSTTFKDEFIDRIKAEGKAEGKAESTAAMLLRLLAVQGLKIPASVRDRVLSCTDLSQLEAWADKAMTASTLEDVFPD
jgi:hypothetical protein